METNKCRSGIILSVIYFIRIYTSIADTLTKRGIRAYFGQGFLLKILFTTSLNYRLFLAKQHLIKDFLQRFLAFRLLKKFIFQNCYLLSVICNAKNSFLETVNCNACNAKMVYGNCQLSNCNACNAKIHFWKLSTVNCNAWCELALSKKQEPVLVFH